MRPEPESKNRETTMKTCQKCQSEMPADAAFCPECGVGIGGADSGGLETLGGLPTIAEESTAHHRSEGATLELGSLFAERYEIEGVLGAGGMGVVYRAIDGVTKRPVALKLIRPERIGGRGEIERLVAEGVTARDIRHPNVVAVYDVGEFEGQPFLSMELLEGQSLRGWLRANSAAGKDAPFMVVARIIAEILKGLEAAHTAGVIHRDLKPENVFLLKEPTAKEVSLKILDFGIARTTATSGGSDSTSGLGTPHYMAPEQITNADQAGPAADLYSLSVLFYELLVGVLPQGHWQPPSGGRSDVPMAIDALIERGLSNRPGSRPRSASAYAAALQAGSVKNSIGDMQERLKKRFELFRNRKAWLWGFAAILALAVISEMLPDGSSSFPNDGEPWFESEGQGFLRGDSLGPDEGDAFDEDSMDEQTDLEVGDLSGMWFDGYGGVYDVKVSRLGRVTGTGTSMDGTPLEFKGRIRDGEFTYKLYSMGYALGEGNGSWDGGPHVAFATYGPDGMLNLKGTFHVNHTE